MLSIIFSAQLIGQRKKTARLLQSLPEQTIKSNGRTQIRYDITEVTREDMNGIRTSYDFSYVEVSGEVTRAKIIDAIVSSVYTKDAEIAILNNYLTDGPSEKYVIYQALRIKAKEVADVVLA